MSEELASAYERFNDAITHWNALLDRSKIPELCHYTTFDGLRGILEDNALRATFSQSLNDGSEWEFGKTFISKYPIPDETVRELMPPSWAVVQPPKSMFVTCFCEEPNLLSMWRSYTGQGGGYCLVFDTKQLDQLQRDKLEPNQFAARLVKIHYGEKPSAQMESLLESGGHSTAAWVLENMIKHEGFQEEKEWRIIVPDPPASIMSFHSSHASIKASVQVRNQHGNKKLPLKKIVCGPTVRNDSALIQTLSWMLEKYGYSDVPVKCSPIPYRLA